MTTKTKQIYEFGVFQVDAAERVLLRDGRPVPLPPKAFEVLLQLVENGGHIVAKDDLLNRVWADTFVEEGNLKVTVSLLRKALEDGADERRYIETVPRRGYRFVASVREVSREPEKLVVQERTRASVTIEESEVIEEPEAVKALAAAKGKRRIGVRAAVAAVAAVALAVVGIYFWMNRPAPGAGMKSIAVLPFKPLVAESRDELLEIGIADTLITRLSNLRAVIIRPISAVRRYGGLEQDPVAAGRALQVESILDGHIQRAGERVRVTVRLVRVEDGSPLWAAQFDENISDLFAVQDSISRRVADAVAVRLSPEEQGRLSKHDTNSSEAYQLYVQGRFLWNKRTGEALWKAIDYFNQAIEKDPNYALAYVGIADAYTVLPGYGRVPIAETLPKAKAAALKALELDSGLPEAHTTLASLSADEWNWAEADWRFKRALELNPNYPTAHQWYGEYLTHIGRLDEALYELQRAQELDPTSIIIKCLVGQTFYLLRRYDEAIEHLKKSLEMDANFVGTHWFLGMSYAQKAMYEESRAEFEKAVTLSNGATNLLALFGVAQARVGNQTAAQSILDKLKALVKQKQARPADLAAIYTGLGDSERAFEWLEKAYEERADLMFYLQIDPFFDALRTDPRFADLIARAGFPQ